MANESREESKIIQFTFELDDPDLEDEERLKFAQKLLPELRNLNEVEKADRAEELTPEGGSKRGISTLIGTLTAQVSFKNIKGFLGFLGDRLQDKPIKIHVKVGDRETTIEAKSRKELLEAERVAKEFLELMGKESSV